MKADQIILTCPTRTCISYSKSYTNQTRQYANAVDPLSSWTPLLASCISGPNSRENKAKHCSMRINLYM